MREPFPTCVNNPLTFVKGSYTTPQGVARSEQSRGQRTFKLTVEVPATPPLRCGYRPRIGAPRPTHSGPASSVWKATTPSTASRPVRPPS
jgi:hypothetical protein